MCMNIITIPADRELKCHRTPSYCCRLHIQWYFDYCSLPINQRISLV